MIQSISIWLILRFLKHKMLKHSISSNGKDSLDTGTYYLTRNRNRLTSTPREDTDFEAMESRY